MCVISVGSFIWTHVTNLQETGLPSKIEIQSLLSNSHFQEKFKTDFRKFSKHIELSGFYDELNIGKIEFSFRTYQHFRNTYWYIISQSLVLIL